MRTVRSVLVFFGAFLLCFGAGLYGATIAGHARTVARLLQTEEPCIHEHLLRSAALGVFAFGALNVYAYFRVEATWLAAFLNIAGALHYLYSAYKGHFSLMFVVMILGFLSMQAYHGYLHMSMNDLVKKRA